MHMVIFGNSKKGPSTNCRIENELLSEAQGTVIRHCNDIVSTIGNYGIYDKLWNVSPGYR